MDFTKYDYLIAIDNLWVPFITGKSSNGLQWKMVVGKLFIAAQARSNMETLSCCDNFLSKPDSLFKSTSTYFGAF